MGNPDSIVATLQSANRRNRNRLFFVSSCLIVVVFFGWAWSSGLQTYRLAKFQVKNLIERSITEGSSIYIQKEINSFVEATNKSHLIPISIEISNDDKIIARSENYENHSFQFFQREFFLTPDGDPIASKIGFLLTRILWIFFIIVGVFLGLTFFLNKKSQAQFNTQLKMLMESLENFVSEIEALSHQVSTSPEVLNKLPKISVHANQKEILTLQKSFEELLRKTWILHHKTIDNEILRERTLFSSQMVHDLKSPLAALKFGFTKFDSPDSDSKGVILNALDRFEKILEKHGSKTHFIVEHFKFFPIVESVFREKLFVLSSRAETGFENKTPLELVTLESPANLSLESVFGEPTEFERALSNILNNAIEATSAQDRKIKIEVSREPIERGDSVSFVKIKIQDNGPGIPPEILVNLGQAGATMGKIHGTGLGLFQAKKAIERGFGNIKISSNPNQGTTVEILLKLLNQKTSSA